MKTYTLHTKLLRGALMAWVLLASLHVSVSVARASTTPISRWAVLEAIHQVENPNNSRRPGPYGELGAYQFRPMTWALHSRRPFSEALDRRTSDLVAVKHHDWICEQLTQRGIEPSVYNVALAWNAGINAAVRGVAPRSSHDYAARVGNIAADLNRRTLAAR